jgi:uncharacterized protein
MLLVDEGCTVPFISRYRKEKTGGLDEVQIRSISEQYESHLEIEKRRAFILETLKKLEKLTPDLEKKVQAAADLNQLEDLYAPYKVKKKSKGTIAKEAGLEPLAKAILTESLSKDELAAKYADTFINKEKGIENYEAALSGAMDIVTEEMAHHTELKEDLRGRYWGSALFVSSKRKNAEEVQDYQKYRDYFEFSCPISDLKEAKGTHRFLAIRRGVTQKILKAEVEYDQEAAINLVKGYFFDGSTGSEEVISDCAKKAIKVYIHSSLELEIKSALKEISDTSAIDVFGVNLKNLLLAPYVGAKTILGIDPGVRTGCKLAIVDKTGKFLVDTVIYPFPPQNNVKESIQILDAIIEQFKVENIAIGNGTYGRETLQLVQKGVEKVKGGSVKATMISESGASIYSASDIARKEFPDKDLTVRGAISIARRFQDPLAELVKIDPKSIGVGQYQHDVNQSKLKKSLGGVVESCVNYVGVDLNTASAPLLSFVSGIGPTLASNIVGHREKIGGFKNRQELLNVSRFSPKVFVQSAGFLRIYGQENPLDGTFIHPESYDKIEGWSKSQGVSLAELVSDQELILKLERDQAFKDEVGEFTHKDIIQSLRAPSQDPRTEFKSVDFRDDVKSIADLKVGEWFQGVVTNITQFGAFVDIGIKENGLVHVSQMADYFVKNALEVFKVGDQVKVRVMEVDMDRKRIALSCKKEEGYVDRSGGARDSKGSRSGGHKPRSNNKRPAAPQTLKNNAFSALKNFKV